MGILTFNANWPSGSAGSGNVPTDIYITGTDWQYTPLYMPGNAGNLAKSGYQWLGWSTSSSASTPDYTGGEFWQMASDFFGWDNEWDTVTLYAVWTATSPPTTHTVSYHGNGNTGGFAPNDQNSPYNSGSTVTVLGNTGGLIKVGYRFLGWNTNSSATSTQYVAGNTFNISANITLYAVWKQTFTLTYHGNGATGGSVPNDSSNPYDTGSTVTVLGNIGNLVKNNHTFLGWSTNSNASSAQYTQGSTFTISQNTILYAVWQPNPTYSLTYQGNGNTGGSAPSDSNSPYQNGSTVTVLGNTGNLVKTGYRFLGWNTNSSATTPQYTAGNTFTINANTTLYAIWKQIFTVTYNDNGAISGTAPNDGSSPYDTGSTVTVLGNTGNLVKTGYTFLGWATSNSASSAQYTAGNTFTITQNTTLYAVWQAIPKYTITYDGNGATHGTVPTDNNQYQTGTPVTVQANSGNLERASYTFLGWAKNSNVTTAEFAVNGSTVTPPTFIMDVGNVVLYAVWVSNSGGVFDGGVINNSLEIKCKFPSLLEVWADVNAWMTAPVGSLPDYSAYLRFTNKNSSPALSTDIYGIAFKDKDSNYYVSGIGINDSLLVRKNLYAQFGSIGELSVPTKLQVDIIENFVSSNKDLVIKANVGNVIKLDGNVQITGTLTGGGSGGGSGNWNGGDVTKDIVVKGKWASLLEDGVSTDVKDWLWTMPIDWPDHSACIKFVDKTTGNWIDMFGLSISNGQDEGPTLCVGYNLMYRGDLVGRGIWKSYEGGAILHGGYNSDNVTKKCGWAPTANPFIWLAEGSVDSRCNTLEIRNGKNFVWGWAHLEANNLLCHGFVGTNYLSALSGSGNITLNNHLIPYSNHTTDLGALNLAYRSIYGLHIHAANVDASLGVKTEDIYSPTKPNSYIRYRSTGNLITLDGNVTITGTLNATSTNPFNQSLNTNNSVQFVNVTSTGNIIPASNLTGSVGLNGQMWNAGYIQNVYASMLQAIGSVNTDTINGVSSNSGNGLLIQTYNNGSYPLRIRASNVVPFSNNTGQLGTSSTMWGSSYIQNMHGSMLQVIDYVNTDTINSTSNRYMLIQTYNNGAQNLYLRAANVLPWSYATTIIGSQANYFAGVWMGTCGYKNQYNFGCERSKSGQVWEPLIKNTESALKILAHEVKKTVRHITYSGEADDEIICVCGKSVKRPCPECEEEWLDRYCKNTGERNEAASFLILEHAAALAKMQTLLDEANQRIVVLEKKLVASKGWINYGK